MTWRPKTWNLVAGTWNVMNERHTSANYSSWTYKSYASFALLEHSLYHLMCPLQLMLYWPLQYQKGDNVIWNWINLEYDTIQLICAHNELPIMFCSADDDLLNLNAPTYYNWTNKPNDRLPKYICSKTVHYDTPTYSRLQWATPVLRLTYKMISSVLSVGPSNGYNTRLVNSLGNYVYDMFKSSQQEAPASTIMSQSGKSSFS